MFLICVFTLFSYCVSLVLFFLLLASSLQLRHSNNLRDLNTLNLLVYLLPIFFGRSSALLCISFRNSFLSSGPLRIAGQSVTSSLVPPSLSSPRSSYLHFPWQSVMLWNTTLMGCSSMRCACSLAWWWYTNTGIASPRKIWSFPSEARQLCGKLRIHYSLVARTTLKKTTVVIYITVGDLLPALLVVWVVSSYIMDADRHMDKVARVDIHHHRKGTKDHPRLYAGWERPVDCHE